MNAFRLTELVKEVDPSEQLDEEVEEILLQIADDFIEQTVTQVETLQTKDRFRAARTQNYWFTKALNSRIEPR